MLCGVSLLSACEGSIGDVPEPDRPPVCRAGRCVDDPGEVLPAESSAYPRLSHRQYDNTLTALFDLEEAPDLATSFEADPRGSSNFDNDGTVLDVTPNLWSDYQRGAESMAQRALSDPAVMAAAVRDNGGDRDGFIAQFGQRAFRRPLSSAEETTYRELFDAGQTHRPGASAFDAGVAIIIEAMLQSPHFLYRVEEGPVQGATSAVPAEHIALDDWQLASRLSYFLWDSMPDDALFAAAAAGRLTDGEELRTQALRMLEDPRADAKILDFHSQLFEFDLHGAVRSSELGENIGRSMRREAELFIEDVIDSDGGLNEILTSSHTFVDRSLANLYGLEGDFDETFQRVELDPTQRAGVLTHAGFLASHAGDAAPILRGVYVNLYLLCANLPEPPDFDPPVLEGTTRRERIDSVTGQGTCGQTCHYEVINPVGFALENFDDVGRWRDTDNGEPVNAEARYAFQVDLENVTWNGPAQMARAIARSADAHECYAQNWIEYGYGRAVSSGDLELVRTLGLGSREEGWSVKRLIVGLVDTLAFRTRAPQTDAAEEEDGE